jgi:hypothetical protein
VNVFELYGDDNVGVYNGDMDEMDMDDTLPLEIELGIWMVGFDGICVNVIRVQSYSHNELPSNQRSKRRFTAQTLKPIY